jgi:hypothetical protein
MQRGSKCSGEVGTAPKCSLTIGSEMIAEIAGLILLEEGHEKVML